MSYKAAIKIVLSLLFLAYLSFKVDLPLVLRSLSSVEPSWYTLSLLVLLVNNLVLAQKYKIVMKPSGIYQPVLKLLQINFICRFYSMFLTTAVGQGVIRWHMTTKNQEGRLKFLAVMLFERSSFLFALLFAFLVSTFLVPNAKAQEITNRIYPFLVLGLCGLLLFYFFLNYPPLYLAARNLISRPNTTSTNTLAGKLSRLMSTFSIFYKKKAVLSSSLFFAFLWQFLFLLRIYLLIISIKVPLGFVHLTWIASLVLLLQVLPISLNGIGIRETAYAFFFVMFDLPPEKGVLTGILCFSHMLFMSMIGGVLHLLSRE
jgi:uncharacterized protein (TIRG00374 family)